MAPRSAPELTGWSGLRGQIGGGWVEPPGLGLANLNRCETLCAEFVVGWVKPVQKRDDKVHRVDFLAVPLKARIRHPRFGIDRITL